MAKPKAQKYEIVAPIVGHEPGEVVTADDIAPANVDVLLKSGHVKKTNK